MHVSSQAAAWDGWPDGPIEHTFTVEEVKNTDHLAVNWSCQTSGARTGFSTAESWSTGRKSERRCLGVLFCANEWCNVIIRPKTRANLIEKQLSKPCVCGATLQQSQPDCPTRQVLWSYKHGIHFIHTGYHNHPRPTHIIHMSKNQREKFKELVEQHPKSGPLQLLVGAPTLHGPGASVADISPVLLNKDRIAYELEKVRHPKRPGGSADDLNIKEFSLFCAENEGFIIHSVIREVVVICMHQPLMLAELVKENSMSIPDEPVNGIVSDAAHGFWRERNCLLIVSSAYSATLRCWIPGVLSYTNGATTEHYRHHFLALFLAIARERRSHGWDISSDEHFGNVRTYSSM